MRIVAGRPFEIVTQVEQYDRPVSFDASPTASTGTVTDGLSGSYTIVGTLSTLGTSEITLTGDVDSVEHVHTIPVEVVGGNYFEVSALRRLEGMDASFITADDVAKVRDRVTAAIEKHCGTSFVSTARTVDARCVAGGLLITEQYPVSITECRVDGVVVASNEFVIEPGGFIETPSQLTGTVELDVTRGYSTVCPTDLSEAAMMWARSLLLRTRGSSLIDDRAKSISTDVGSISLTMPGKDTPSGIPDVDTTLNAWRSEVAGVLLA